MPSAKRVIAYFDIVIATASSSIEIEELLGKKVYLELFVKVIEKWRDREKYLNEIGYKDFKLDN